MLEWWGACWRRLPTVLHRCDFQSSIPTAPRWGYPPTPVAMSAGDTGAPGVTAGADGTESEFVGASDAARMLGVSSQWIRRQAADGHLGARRVGGRWLLDAEQVRARAGRRRQELERRLPAAGASPAAPPTPSRPVTAADSAPQRSHEPAHAQVTDAVGEWERDAWALERQLLLAQADAAERRAQLSRLEATISQRDATIASLQAELGRLRGERDRWQQAASTLLITFAADTPPP